jgi:hypothetical protein
VTQFAELLDAALEASPEPRPETAFEQSLRALECALAAFVSADGLTPPAPWAQELGIEGACTVDDVKRAFRRLAFATHPDRPGGSHDAFLRAKKLLDEALTSPRPARKPERAALRYAVAEPRAMQRSRVHSAYA